MDAHVLRRKAERSLRVAANLTHAKVAAILRQLAAQHLEQADALDPPKNDRRAGTVNGLISSKRKRAPIRPTEL